MPLADDLRAISGDALQRLDAVHDYFQHTRLVWQSFQTVVAAGYTTSDTNPATGTFIDQAGLVALSEPYTRQYLATFTFRQFVSEFESFFFAFFRRVLLHNPWQFKKCQVEFEAVLRAKDRDEVIDGVILKQLNDVKYENVREWFKALEGAMALGCHSR